VAASDSERFERKRVSWRERVFVVCEKLEGRKRRTR
jgi:hypothetical protein